MVLPFFAPVGALATAWAIAVSNSDCERIRDGLIARRTQLSNAIRGYAAEFGLIAAKGADKIEPLLARIAQDENLPDLARELFAVQGREYARLGSELKEIEARLLAWHRADATSRRLAQIPGVGPVTAAALVMIRPERSSPRAIAVGLSSPCRWASCTRASRNTS